ncbi:MAG: alpha/beta hydrolase [Burkholderiales bacterium]|jgi:hypothetical protein|nr:alpha/beta hydrolase [Burkholderiales bacterium]
MNFLKTPFAAALAFTTFHVAPVDATAAPVVRERVVFTVDGQTVRGHLYRPATVAGRAAPAVVVGGSLTSVKEQMAGTYARELAERGIVALAIDYRHWGESDGLPRQLEDNVTKDADLRAAVRWLGSQHDVDRDAVGLLGICASAANVLDAAAHNPDVKAVATVAGWFAGPDDVAMVYGGEAAVAALRTQAADAAARYATDGVAPAITAYAPAGQSGSHVGDHLSYYFDPQRGNIAAWKNAFAVQSWTAWLDRDPLRAAAAVTAPTLVVHSDQAALPEHARRVHAQLAGPKALHWTADPHLDFYDRPATVAATSDRIADFLRDVARAASTHRTAAR